MLVLPYQHLLVMGPWQHVGPENHVAGEVDFGVNALISGNLAPNVFSFVRRWFDRFVDAATAPQPRKLTPEEKLAMAIKHAESAQEKDKQQDSGTSLVVPTHPRGPYTSISHLSTSFQSFSLDPSGPSFYMLPSAAPRERFNPNEPLPPPVRYFRMGGGDGHK